MFIPSTRSWEEYIHYYVRKISSFWVEIILLFNRFILLFYKFLININLFMNNSNKM